MISFALKKSILWIVATITLFAATTSSGAEKPTCKGEVSPQCAFSFNEYLIAKPRFTLPFYLFNGHIMIDGAVNGRRGKFMFNTGTEFPIFSTITTWPYPRINLLGRGTRLLVRK